MKKEFTIDNIHIGMKVFALDTDYKGLEGWIIDVKEGEEKETENESILDIYVAFEETYDLEKTHPHLYDTWSFPNEVIPPALDCVIMAEDMLAYYQEEEDELPITLAGLYVCNNCDEILDHVFETQYDDITWNFEDGRYIKYNGSGETEGKRCPYCNIRINDDEEKMFPY